MRNRRQAKPCPKAMTLPRPRRTTLAIANTCSRCQLEPFAKYAGKRMPDTPIYAFTHSVSIAETLSNHT